MSNDSDVVKHAAKLQLPASTMDVSASDAGNTAARNAAGVPLPSSSVLQSYNVAQNVLSSTSNSFSSSSQYSSDQPQPLAENIKQHVNLHLNKVVADSKQLKQKLQNDWSKGFNSINQTLKTMVERKSPETGVRKSTPTEPEESNVEDVVGSLETMGSMHERQGDYRAARDLFGEVLRVQKLILGENDAAIAITLCRLGDLHYKCGKPLRALSSYKRALKIKRNLLGRYHPEVAATLNVIGQIHEDNEDTEKAMDTYKEALEIYNRNTFHTLQPTELGRNITHYNNHKEQVRATKFDKLLVETKLSELQMSFQKKMKEKSANITEKPSRAHVKSRSRSPKNMKKSKSGKNKGKNKGKDDIYESRDTKDDNVGKNFRKKKSKLSPSPAWNEKGKRQSSSRIYDNKEKEEIGDGRSSSRYHRDDRNRRSSSQLRRERSASRLSSEGRRKSSHLRDSSGDELERSISSKSQDNSVGKSSSRPRNEERKDNVKRRGKSGRKMSRSKSHNTGVEIGNKEKGKMRRAKRRSSKTHSLSRLHDNNDSHVESSGEGDSDIKTEFDTTVIKEATRKKGKKSKKSSNLRTNNSSDTAESNTTGRCDLHDNKVKNKKEVRDEKFDIESENTNHEGGSFDTEGILGRSYKNSTATGESISEFLPTLPSTALDETKSEFNVGKSSSQRKNDEGKSSSQGKMRKNRSSSAHGQEKKLNGSNIRESVEDSDLDEIMDSISLTTSKKTRSMKLPLTQSRSLMRQRSSVSLNESMLVEKGSDEDSANKLKKSSPWKRPTGDLMEKNSRDEGSLIKLKKSSSFFKKCLPNISSKSSYEAKSNLSKDSKDLASEVTEVIKNPSPRKAMSPIKLNKMASMIVVDKTVSKLSPSNPKTRLPDDSNKSIDDSVSSSSDIDEKLEFVAKFSAVSKKDSSDSKSKGKKAKVNKKSKDIGLKLDHRNSDDSKVSKKIKEGYRESKESNKKKSRIIQAKERKSEISDNEDRNNELSQLTNESNGKNKESTKKKSKALQTKGSIENKQSKGSQEKLKSKSSSSSTERHMSLMFGKSEETKTHTSNCSDNEAHSKSASVTDESSCPGSISKVSIESQESDISAITDTFGKSNFDNSTDPNKKKPIKSKKKQFLFSRSKSKNEDNGENNKNMSNVKKKKEQNSGKDEEDEEDTGYRSRKPNPELKIIIE